VALRAVGREQGGAVVYRGKTRRREDREGE
jgi:hypothetical protein